MEAIRRDVFGPGRARLFTGMLERALRDPVFERLRSELVAEHCSLLSDLLSTLSAGGPDGADRLDPIERLLGPCLRRLLLSGRPISRVSSSRNSSTPCWRDSGPAAPAPDLPPGGELLCR